MLMPEEPTFTSRDAQREATRRRLYDCALEEFRRTGFQAARIDDIARQAAVSRAAFYFHFAAKDLVMHEVLETADACAVMAMSGASTIDAILASVGDAWCGCWSREPKLAADAMAIDTIRRPGTLNKALAAQFASHGNPQLLADVFLAGCRAVVVQWARAPETSLTEPMRAWARLFTKGILVTTH
jgi:AcrR family transcriptional regulator